MAASKAEQMSAPDYAQYSPQDSSCAHGGVHRCEKAQEPARRRIVFSMALLPIAATALFVFRLTKSRRTFYARIECLCFHAAWTLSRPSGSGPQPFACLDKRKHGWGALA